MDETIYKLLLLALPVLLGVLSFIGGLAVSSLIKLANTVNKIDQKLAVLIAEHNSLEKRVDKLEADGA